MKDSNENVLTMVNRILLLCFNNMTIVDGVVKFKAKYVTLKAMRDAANVIAQLLYATTHGVTLNKGKKKETAAVNSFVIVQVLKSYAHETGDLDLEELMAKSISYIRGIRDAEFWDFGKMVYDKAWALRETLPDYGIEELQITGMLADMDAYELLEQQPKLTGLELEQQRANLDVKVKDMRSFLSNEMDPLAVVFMNTQPDFYAIYKKARKIPKTSRHKLTADELENTTGAIDMTVLAKDTMEPVIGALCGIASIEFSDTTDETGGSYVDCLLPSAYILTVSCPGYITATNTVELAAGEYKVLEIQLEKDLSGEDVPPVS